MTDQSHSHYERALELQSAGRLREAVDRYRTALALRADYFEAHVNLGNALKALGHLDEALASFRRALELRPDFVELSLNIGAVLHAAGRLEEAAENYHQAISKRPSDARLHNNLAIVLRETRQPERAEVSFRQALALDPRNAVIREGLAGILLVQGKLDEAEEHFRTALAVNPSDADTVQGLADVRMSQGFWGEAIEGYRRALALEPASAASCSGLLMRSQYADSVPPLELWRDHRRFADRFETALARSARPHVNSRDPRRRLKVGYVSADLRSHSVAYFVEPILARHDRSQFEVHCYYAADNTDEVTERFRSLADRWNACAQLTDEQLSERIRADGIDILVDLSGHTAGNRLLAFARKPAPVQVSWVGYPSATGLRSIDYFLTDVVASPPGAGQFGSMVGDAARLYRLPRVFSCYRPPAFAPDPELPPQGAEIVLGTFNNAVKISDRTVGLWSGLLATRTDFRLLAKDKKFADGHFRSAFLERFAARGIDAGRIELLDRSKSDAQHLRQYGCVDIALDTFPYCGVTTTCEALWMGVPVVSLAGDEFVSRMGATLLASVGHSEWVAGDDDELAAIVIGLADDREQRCTLRHTLRAQLRASALLDEAGFTRELEEAYRDMWARWCQGS